MLHQMKLFESPFKRIKDGTKTIEFRLNDEKRQAINIGDKIEFSLLPELKEKLVVEVLEIYGAETFYQLFLNLGDSEEKAKKHTEGMYTIYSKDEEEKYGAWGA